MSSYDGDSYDTSSYSTSAWDILGIVGEYTRVFMRFSLNAVTRITKQLRA